MVKTAMTSVERLETSGTKFEVTSAATTPQGNSNSSSLLQLTVQKLNSKNYVYGSQTVMIFISGRGKFEYITSEISAPTKTDPGFKAWNIDNMMVMSWLLNTMEAHISQNFLFHKIAKSLWEEVAKRYSDRDNSSEIFKLKTKLRNLGQGNNDVDLYFNS